MNTPSDTSAPIAAPRARAEGALIALAAGDALGWPHEFSGRGRGKQRVQATIQFSDWVRKSGGRYFPHAEVVRAGEYSDDTQLTLAVARCRIHAGLGWWNCFTRNELPLWTIYERGGGGATKRAAESWLRGVAPWKQAKDDAIRRYFDAGGNGVAMRVISHALYCAADNEPTNLLRDVVLDGAATHGHPRALVGAAAYAYAAWWLLRSKHTVAFGELATVLLDNSTTWGALPVGSPTNNGWLEAANKMVGNYENTWHQVVEEMRALLAHVRDGLLAGSLADDCEVLEAVGAFGSARGAGTVSAAAATYLTARYAAQPVQGVLRAAFAIGSDTDTIAAMAGGLLGALAGSDWIPQEWFVVQDCEYLRKIANSLVAHLFPLETAGHKIVRPKELDALVEALLAGSREERDFGGTRRISMVEIHHPTSDSHSTVVHAWKLQTSDGQTLYLTQLRRKVQGGSAAVTSERASNVARRPVAVHTEKTPKAHAAGVKLSVSDIAVSADFYERILGLAPVRKTSRFVSFGALSLVDGHYAADLSAGAVELNKSSCCNRVEIHVSDLDVMLGRLVEGQVRLAQPITLMPWGERSMHCIDPDGNIVELVEHRSINRLSIRRVPSSGLPA